LQKIAQHYCSWRLNFAVEAELFARLLERADLLLHTTAATHDMGIGPFERNVKSIAREQIKQLRLSSEMQSYRFFRSASASVHFIYSINVICLKDC
jgi:hypothetical protein